MLNGKDRESGRWAEEPGLLTLQRSAGPTWTFRCGDTREDVWEPQNSARKAPGRWQEKAGAVSWVPRPAPKPDSPHRPYLRLPAWQSRGRHQPPQFQAVAPSTRSGCADAAAPVWTREPAAITSLTTSPNCRLPEPTATSLPFRLWELLAPPFPVSVKSLPLASAFVHLLELFPYIPPPERAWSERDVRELVLFLN